MKKQAEWTNCQNLLSQNYGRNWRCAPHETERIMSMNGTFQWERKPDKDDYISLDCSYDLTSLVGIEGQFRFEITQRSCNFHPLLGGASFQIDLEENNYLSFCNYIDHFNGSYSAFCPCRSCTKYQNEISVSSMKDVCSINISVILDYEHFDAFSETKSTSPPLRKVIASNLPNCLKIDISKSTTNEKLKDKYWLRSPRIENSVGNYLWISRLSSNGSFPSAIALQGCISENQEVHFIVDSQMHLIAEYIKSVYSEASKKTTNDFISNHVTNEER